MCISCDTAGNDHFLDNIIVFDYTHIGVQINGAANILSGVHTWNGGGTGIEINAYQNRLMGCYLDYNLLIIVDPQQTVVENTFFLVTHTVLKANKGTVSTLIMRFNTYTGGDSITLQGNFTSAKAVSISEEINGNKLTRIRAAVNGTDTTVFKFDFSQQLLFPWIDYVTYSLSSSTGPVVTSMAPPVGPVVVVHTAQPTTGVVSMEVAQAL